MKGKSSKLIILGAFILLFILAKVFGLDQYLTLEYAKNNLDTFRDYYASNKSLTISIYMGVYILVTALSIPGAAVLTLVAGALFGLVTGTIVVSFASTIGATCAFLAARLILRDSIQKKFGNRLQSINQGIEKDGAFYLFTLRLVPVVPFFIINLVMGLTKIKTVTFFLVSQIGMLAGTAVYVNAGKQLSQIDSLAGILSPGLLFSFVLLGIFPFIAKAIVNAIKAKKVYQNYKKPTQFDYDMVAIGAGAGGLVTSYIGAAVKAKVALIEKHKMGGDCLNTGCVPSKALIKSATVVQQAKRANDYGIKKMDVEFDFAEVMDRVHEVIKKIEPHDSIERYTGLGVECITGTAKILSPWEIEVNGKTITTRNITIATGASPFVPPIKGIEDIDILVSENLWNIRELPKNFVVLGGGPIGLELAQSFNRLGSNVTLVERGPRIMPREDEDISSVVLNRIKEEGVNVLLNHNAVEFVKEGESKKLICDGPEGKVEVSFDQVLIAVGRRPNIKGFGLEELGVEIRKNGTIEANEYLQTNYPNIFACGDVTGPFQLTHTAAHQAWYCAVNGLFGRLKKFKVDYSVIPWATYTDPEVATVGLNETTAKEKEIDYEVTKYGIDDLDRAIADSEDHGYVKVLTAPGTDKILGATIVGAHASDLLLEFIAAMKHGFGLNKILGTIHTYPTMGEANKYLAGEWKKARKPEKVLNYLEKYFAWERGGSSSSKEANSQTV